MYEETNTNTVHLFYDRIRGGSSGVRAAVL